MAPNLVQKVRAHVTDVYCSFVGSNEFWVVNAAGNAPVQ